VGKCVARATAAARCKSVKTRNKGPTGNQNQLRTRKWEIKGNAARNQTKGAARGRKNAYEKIVAGGSGVTRFNCKQLYGVQRSGVLV